MTNKFNGLCEWVRDVRFILGQGDRFGGHVLGQARLFLVAICHDRLLHLAVDLLLHPIGGCDKAIKAREFEKQTHQANATGTNLNTDQMDRQDQSMQEGKTRRTVKKGHDSGTRIEALVVGLPGLERAAGNIEQLGCLPMGEPLRLQSAIALKQFSASGSLPAWVTIVVASLLILDDCSHGYLLVLKPRSSEK